MCASFGFGAHNAVAYDTSQFRHAQSMGYVIFGAHSPGADAGRFCGRSACMGGFQFHCASSATIAAGVSFSAQSVANAASFGFREFRRSRYECEQASSYSLSVHIPGVDVNRFCCQLMHFAAQMCVRSRRRSGKIRSRRTVLLQIQRTRPGEYMACFSFAGLRHEADP